jgi:hypothetical protein
MKLDQLENTPARKVSRWASRILTVSQDWPAGTSFTSCYDITLVIRCIRHVLFADWITVKRRDRVLQCLKFMQTYRPWEWFLSLS